MCAFPLLLTRLHSSARGLKGKSHMLTVLQRSMAQSQAQRLQLQRSLHSSLLPRLDTRHMQQGQLQHQQRRRPRPK